MAEMSFDDAVEWLSSREGKSVAVEIGTKDPTVEMDAMTIPLVMHVTLGGIESASEVDKDRLMVLIQLPDIQRSRFYLDPAAVPKSRVRRARSAYGSTTTPSTSASQASETEAAFADSHGNSRTSTNR